MFENFLAQLSSKGGGVLRNCPSSFFDFLDFGVMCNFCKNFFKLNCWLFTRQFSSWISFFDLTLYDPEFFLKVLEFDFWPVFKFISCIIWFLTSSFILDWFWPYFFWQGLIFTLIDFWPCLIFDLDWFWPCFFDVYWFWPWFLTWIDFHLVDFWPCLIFDLDWFWPWLIFESSFKMTKVG